MHIDDGREPIDGHLPEGRVADDSGVVDHDVHSPQASRAESMIACPPSGLVTLWESATARPPAGGFRPRRRDGAVPGTYHGRGHELTHDECGRHTSRKCAGNLHR